jgi:hypothetical protein
MASTSRSFPSSLDRDVDVDATPRDGVLQRCIRELTSRSSLNLSVDLVGLPSVQKLRGNGGYDDANGNQNPIAPTFGVDLSCLPQPDGRDAWTLGLGLSSIPRESSEEPSSSWTLSPWPPAGGQPVDEDSATSVETRERLENNSSHEGLSAPGPHHWARHYRPATPHNMLSTFHGTQSTASVPPVTALNAVPVSLTKAPLHPHQTVKGLIGDIKRLGRKMRDHIFKASGRRGKDISHDERTEDPASELGWPVAMYLEQGYYPVSCSLSDFFDFLAYMCSVGHSKRGETVLLPVVWIICQNRVSRRPGTRQARLCLSSILTLRMLVGELCHQCGEKALINFKPKIHASPASDLHPLSWAVLLHTPTLYVKQGIGAPWSLFLGHLPRAPILHLDHRWCLASRMKD